MDRIRLEHVTRLHEAPTLDTPPAGVRDVRLRVAAGEFLALCGRSGSGKSTLLAVMGLLDRAQSGRYLLDGQDVTRLGATASARVRRQRIGFVFQAFQLVPSMSALDNVALPALHAGHSFAEARRRAAALLDRFELLPWRDRRPAMLSGGQRQRVALCRSLVNEPDVILADEPTGNLDALSAERLVATLLTLRQERGCTVVLVTHDDALARRADRVLRIVDGRLA